jgi:hypothetical protein
MSEQNVKLALLPVLNPGDADAKELAHMRSRDGIALTPAS